MSSVVVFVGIRARAPTRVEATPLTTRRLLNGMPIRVLNNTVTGGTGDVLVECGVNGATSGRTASVMPLPGSETTCSSGYRRDPPAAQ